MSVNMDFFMSNIFYEYVFPHKKAPSESFGRSDGLIIFLRLKRGKAISNRPLFYSLPRRRRQYRRLKFKE